MPTTFYQPTALEIATVGNWPEQGRPGHAHFSRAHELLTNINTSFTYDIRNGWQAISQADPNRRYKLTFADEPPACECPNFHDVLKNYQVVIGKGKVRTYCKHTIAWLAYRRILVNHWDLTKNERERCHLPAESAFLHGQHVPATPHALATFAAWLPVDMRNRPVVVARTQPGQTYYH